MSAKKKGPLFPHPEKRPLVVIFFICPVHLERAAFYMLL